MSHQYFLPLRLIGPPVVTQVGKRRKENGAWVDFSILVKFTAKSYEEGTGAWEQSEENNLRETEEKGTGKEALRGEEREERNREWKRE